MKTLVDRIAALGAPLKKYPLAYRGIGLVVALIAYSAGVLLVDSLTHIGFLVVLVALYFLPAVLRAWLLFYWQLREELSAWRGRRSGKAF
ncbi:hypothetical protein [Alcanivorax sp. 1008]|uniref:hypothetical protein n=1 Tax=Alcanivorax sp. 1008 TaxID=2816853 RepID=UPI001DD11713|nr:hypothetical protein [Alcanivorax sp. 1008]MCC1497049.1 hypothetical protein [Alcanivorax sp. 1008]